MPSLGEEWLRSKLNNGHRHYDLVLLQAALADIFKEMDALRAKVEDLEYEIQDLVDQ